MAAACGRARGARLRYVFYGYTALALASGLLAALGRAPFSRTAALVLLAGYVVFVGLAVAFPRMRVFTHAIWRGPAGARGVALTFDDGPHPEHTRRVLDLLDSHGVRATFFVIGAKAERHPEVVREIVARGHAVAGHSYDHVRTYTFRGVRALQADQDASDRVLGSLLGRAPRLFRPPFGLVNPRIGRLIEERGLVHVHWSVKAIDGVAGASADRVVARVVRGLRDGAIVLLHDAAERDDRPPVILEALPRILDAMRQHNLTGVTVEELLGSASGEVASQSRAGERREVS